MLVLYVLAIVVLWRDIEEVDISSGILIVSGFVSMAIWIVSVFVRLEGPFLGFLILYLAYLIVLLAICAASDWLVARIRKRRDSIVEAAEDSVQGTGQAETVSKEQFDGQPEKTVDKSLVGSYSTVLVL